MQKITTFLTFNDRAEEAMNFYVSVFKNARVVSEMRNGEMFFGGIFEIDGQRFHVLNGGSSFSFASGMSLFVNAETQEEIDELYGKLSDGGEKQPCGWLKDRFGISWQIIPPVLGKLLSDPDHEKANRAMQAMMKMQKIVIADLEAAFDGEEVAI
ncbi:MAG TPA: VOC family protein [Patescibacteria group bacterium]|nr:VOC family protein [Patescibacteria group bacterium]